MGKFYKDITYILFQVDSNLLYVQKYLYYLHNETFAQDPIQIHINYYKHCNETLNAFLDLANMISEKKKIGRKSDKSIFRRMRGRFDEDMLLRDFLLLLEESWNSYANDEAQEMWHFTPEGQSWCLTVGIISEWKAATQNCIEYIYGSNDRMSKILKCVTHGKAKKMRGVKTPSEQDLSVFLCICDKIKSDLINKQYIISLPKKTLQAYLALYFLCHVWQPRRQDFCLLAIKIEENDIERPYIDLMRQELKIQYSKTNQKYDRTVSLKDHQSFIYAMSLMGYTKYSYFVSWSYNSCATMIPQLFLEYGRQMVDFYDTNIWWTLTTLRQLIGIRDLDALGHLNNSAYNAGHSLRVHMKYYLRIAHLLLAR
eukprot:510578_1